MNEPGYKPATAAKIGGVTRRQLQYWDKSRLICPSVVHGRRRLYSFFDLVEIRTVARLRDDGRISLQKVRKVVAELEAFRDRPLRECTLFSDGGTIFWVEENPDGTAVIDVLRRYQVVMCVSLHKVEFEVRQSLDEDGLAQPPLTTALAA